MKTHSALRKHNDVINGLGVKIEISYKPSCPGYVMEDGDPSAIDHDSSDSSELSRSFTIETWNKQGLKYGIGGNHCNNWAFDSSSDSKNICG